MRSLCGLAACLRCTTGGLRASVATCGEHGEYPTNTHDTSTPSSSTLCMQLLDADADTAAGAAPLAERVVECVDATRDTLDVHCDAATARVPTNLLPIRAPEKTVDPSSIVSVALHAMFSRGAGC
eukprot:TRINITY_DN766_c0_g1_i3.p4 TRINITY_DN766_c0_g1~~TRINITY_DN766_c0_g1_i3.p4  ORF type:complete len:125 (+),score=6.49 TRINITY_DN766_c0_g1_i3:739-1113(+)